MTRTGDLVFAEDGHGDIWRYEALGGDGLTLVERATVDDAVRRHNLARVDRAFDTWADLDRFRTEGAEPFLGGSRPRATTSPPRTRHGGCARSGGGSAPDLDVVAEGSETHGRG